jgi:ribosomal protein S18 acetylase RimI-like enzyme
VAQSDATESCQGLGIGRLLLRAAIHEFQSRGAGQLFLETNSVLTPAIALYKSFGFEHRERPVGPSSYARSNVYMVYRGTPSGA